MQVIVNDQTIELVTSARLPDLFQKLNLTLQSFAVALNQTIIPRSEFDKTSLKEGDQIEIIRAVGGG